jgi:hypothetical protein
VDSERIRKTKAGRTRYETRRIADFVSGTRIGTVEVKRMIERDLPKQERKRYRSLLYGC